MHNAINNWLTNYSRFNNSQISIYVVQFVLRWLHIHEGSNNRSTVNDMLRSVRYRARPRALVNFTELQFSPLFFLQHKPWTVKIDFGVPFDKAGML